MCSLNESSKSPQIQNDQAKTSIRYKNSGRSAFAQVLALLIQNWLLLIMGMDMVLPTVVIGALYKNKSENLIMDDDQASWYGSLPSFCYPIGSLMSGLLQEKFGRRGSAVLINIPMFAAWLTLYFANSIPTLYAVSIIMGLSGGLAEAPLHAYIGEIGEPYLRGTLSTITTFIVSIGCFITYVNGYFFDWRTVALVSSAFPVIGLFLMAQIPESPTWLIERNRSEDAKKSLCWLRGWVQPEEVEEEFQALVNYVTANQNGTSSIESVPTNGERSPIRKAGYLKTQLKELKKKNVLRPLRMVFIVFVVSCTADVVGMYPYQVPIYDYLQSPIDSSLILVVNQFLFLLGAIVNVMVLRRVGKRRLALLSYGLAAVCIFGVASYCSFLKDSIQTPMFSWIPISFFFLLNFLSGLSLIGLPWQLVCEVFPPKARGTATGISAAWSYFVEFLMDKSFLFIEASIDLSGLMYLSGLGTVLGLIYFYFCLPETEAKTLEQIESYFTDSYDRNEKFCIGKSGKNTQSPSQL